MYVTVYGLDAMNLAKSNLGTDFKGHVNTYWRSKILKRLTASAFFNVADLIGALLGGGSTPGG